MDLLTGVMEVLRKPKPSRAGFNIGSPIAAGAASLFAFVCEALFLDPLPTYVQNTLRKSPLLLRWMDDLLHMWRRGDERGVVYKALQISQNKNFYGNSWTEKKQKRSGSSSERTPG